MVGVVCPVAVLMYTVLGEIHYLAGMIHSVAGVICPVARVINSRCTCTAGLQYLGVGVSGSTFPNSNESTKKTTDRLSAAIA